MNKDKIKQQQKLRRKKRVNVKGTEKRPRLSIFRSLKDMYAQLIDDDTQTTIVSASLRDIKDAKKIKKVDAAREIGKILAQKALEKKITTAVFDKGSYKYHGRVKELADGAREGGLKF